jgi:serine/threonine-protein kinase RsbW
MARPLTLTKPAIEENLALFLTLVDVLAQRHDLQPSSVVDLRLLAEEACANVVLHAFDGAAPGELTLQVSYADGLAELLIEDDGRHFDPESAPLPALDAAWDEREVGGLGWHLIRRLSDELHYERVGDRNRLTLRKRVEAA